MHALQLRILTGEDKGKQALVIPPGGILGRDDEAVLRFGVRGVSLQHARLTYEEGWSLSDLNSTNGTFFGDEKLSGKAKRLPSEGVFRLGIHEVGFQYVTLPSQPRLSLDSDIDTPPTMIRTVPEFQVDETLIVKAKASSTVSPTSAKEPHVPRHPDPLSVQQQQLAHMEHQLTQTQQQLTQTQQQLTQTQQQLTQTQQQLAQAQQELHEHHLKRQELEKSLGASRRSNEILLAEQQKLQQSLHTLRTTYEEQQKQYAHLPAENLRLQALITPLEDRLERLEERYTIQRELNTLLSKQKLRVEEESGLISTLWKEAGVLRRQNLRLEASNRQLWNALLGLTPDSTEPSSSAPKTDSTSLTKP